MDVSRGLTQRKNILQIERQFAGLLIIFRLLSVRIGATTSGAETINNLVIVVVVQCSQSTFVGGLSADCADALGITGFCTGGFYPLSGIAVVTGLCSAPSTGTVHIVVVVQPRQGLHKGITAVRALKGLSTGCLTGRLLGYGDGSISVLAAGIPCLADRALIGILTEVMGCRDNFLIQGCVATVTLLILVVTVDGTGSSLGCNSLPIVAQLVHNFLFYQDLFTDRALLASFQTGFGTGSSLNRQDFLRVRQLLKGFVRIVAAQFAGINNVAFLSTGSLLLHQNLVLMCGGDIPLIGSFTSSALIDFSAGS